MQGPLPFSSHAPSPPTECRVVQCDGSWDKEEWTHSSKICKGIFRFYEAKCAVLQFTFEIGETFPSSIGTLQGATIHTFFLSFTVLYVMFPPSAVCLYVVQLWLYILYLPVLPWAGENTDYACGLFWFQRLLLSLLVEQRDQLSFWFCHFFCSGIHVTKTGCWHQQCGRIWYESNTILNDSLLQYKWCVQIILI